MAQLHGGFSLAWDYYHCLAVLNIHFWVEKQTHGKRAKEFRIIMTLEYRNGAGGLEICVVAFDTNIIGVCPPRILVICEVTAVN